MKRISPEQLTDLLESTHAGYYAYLSSLDPFAQTTYSVAWAGEDTSLNWFHIAREYTEKWHHQQQIRDAVGQTESLMTRDLFYPCMDTFMRGLPHTYRDVHAEPGTVIQVAITGYSGGSWYLVRTADNWQIDKNFHDAVNASVNIEPDIAWKLFTKGISSQSAIERSAISGDSALVERIFYMIAVIA